MWVCLIGLAILGGCSGTPRPRHRLGALPFFGWAALYETADPGDLGEHSYQTPELREASRGILYTCRAGFVDIAHLRTMTDWAWYSAVEVRSALQAHKHELTIHGMDEARYFLRFNYPPFWDSLGPILKDAFIGELSIGMGLKLADLMLTWHEIITWYGYKSVGFISEFRSAFTWDDMSSHVIGLRVAKQALTANPRALDELSVFDQAVTRGLSRQLNELGAVSPKQTRQAIRAVQGWWWADDAPKKRQVETGLSTGWLTPWLVPGFGPCGDQPTRPLELAAIDPMLGPGDDAFYELWLDSDIWEMDDIRMSVKPKLPADRPLHPRTDFPRILKQIRKAVVDRYGKAALRR